MTQLYTIVSYTCFEFLVFVVVVLIRDLTMLPWLTWNFLYRPSWPQNRDLSDSASQVLGLQAGYHTQPK